MQLHNDHAELLVCFYIPEAAENFIKGLFINQQLQIADAKSKTTFRITQVESVGEGLNAEGLKDGRFGGLKYEKVVLLQPISPLVAEKMSGVIMIIVRPRMKTLKIALCITG